MNAPANESTTTARIIGTTEHGWPLVRLARPIRMVCHGQVRKPLYVAILQRSGQQTAVYASTVDGRIPNLQAVRFLQARLDMNGILSCLGAL